MLKIKILLSVIVLVILGYIVTKTVNLHKTVHLLQTMPITVLLFLFFLSTVLLVFKGLRFYILLRNSNVKLSFWEIMKVSFAGQATSPFPGGEATRGLLLKKKNNVSYEKSSGTIVTQPLMEIIVSSLITFFGSFFYHDLIIPSIILLTILSFIVFILLHPTLLPILLKHLSKKQKYTHAKEKVLTAQKNIKHNMVRKTSYAPNIALYKTFSVILIANLVGGLLLMILFSTFHIHLSFWQCFFLYAASVVLQNISILPGGIGLTEGGLTGLLYFFHIALSTAVTVVLLFRVITFLYSILLGLLFILLFYAKTLLFNKNKSA